VSVTALETSLLLHVEQITAGDAECQFCDSRAVVTMGNGADPDPEPMCGQHAGDWLDFTRRTVFDVLTDRR
jgi:hypothetical protein